MLAERRMMLTEIRIIPKEVDVDFEYQLQESLVLCLTPAERGITRPKKKWIQIFKTQKKVKNIK